MIVGRAACPSVSRGSPPTAARTIDLAETDADDVPDRVRDLTDGRGADSVVDAVGMEAHGSPVAEDAQKALRFLPKKLQEIAMTADGLRTVSTRSTRAFESVRRGGTVSISGVYGGAASPMPMLQLFDSKPSCGGPGQRAPVVRRASSSC